MPPARLLSALCLWPAISIAAPAQVLPAEVSLQPIASGFSQPGAVRTAGDTRLFVVEQGGLIRIVNGGVVGSDFLDFGADPPPLGFTSGGERGLLGLAFAPDYASSGRLYVYYTDASGDSVVARYTVDTGNADRADPASAELVLRVDQDYSNHNGGDLQFGPDGFLYIGLGDGGSGNDPCNRAQTLDPSTLDNGSGCSADSAFTGSGGDADSRALLGKLLRIDVSSGGTGGERCGLSAGTAGYGIPADNPYAAADGVCDEVLANGLRNPFRFSFDRDNGDLLIGDVGQNAREEVDRLPAGTSGQNFGWRCVEGDIDTPDLTPCADTSGFTAPVLVYDHTVGQSLTGGYRYRGPQQALTGAYFFGDFVAGTLMAARPLADGWHRVVWRDNGESPSSFGEDASGDVYVLDYGAGTLAKIVTTSLFVDSFEPER